MSRLAKVIVLFVSLIGLSLSGGNALAVTDTFPASGNWTAPAGVTSITVEAWGGGGAGGGNTTTADGGGGGGGGAYSSTANIAVTPGNVYTVTVGAGGIAVAGGSGGAGGDSWFSTAGTILAKGGAGGVSPVAGAGGIGGAGGAAASSIGTIKFTGGNGGTGRNNNTGRGGPGGSSAGTAANGTNGPNPWATVTAAAAPAGGGIGGNGGAAAANGAAPALGNGGGGGGSGDTGTRTGGNGAGGKVAITYTPPPPPDHIQISHDGSALTCSPEIVTITACANAACTTPHYSGGVSVTLTPGGQTFAIDVTGINSAATVQQSTAGAVTLAATSVPAATSATPTTCWNTATSTASCAMTFNDSGFVVTVPNHTSCSNATATIEAVQTAPGTGRCVPAYKSVTRAVNLYSTYVSPATGTQVITASTGAVSTTAPGTAHNLAFDVNGTVTITLSYPDAGQLTLTASGTAPTGAAMTGSSSFVVAPASFAFSAIPAAPLTAGQPFNATVTAMRPACTMPAAPAAATPNFNGTVTLTSSNPQPGIGNATAINTSLSGFSNGTASTNLTWNEVGTIDLNASMSAYLGWTLPTAVTGTQAGVGRFHPAYFDTVVTPGCNTFTYAGSTTPVKAGQPFTVTVKAKRFGGDTTDATNTANYAGANAYLTTLSNAGDSTGLASNTIAAASFDNWGRGSANMTYEVATPQTALLTLTMRATDADPTPVSSSGHTEGTAEIRSGRVKLFNAYGSELLQLPIPIALQYYTSNGWVSNMADTCSAISAGNFAFSSPGNNLAACETAMTVSGSSPNYTLRLDAPGSGNNGWTDLTLNLGTAASGSTCTAKNAATGFTGVATTTNMLWLQFPWGGAGATNPTARTTFGVYKGANEFIYMRENY